MVGLYLLLVGLSSTHCRLLERLSLLLSLHHSLFKFLVQLHANLGPTDTSCHAACNPTYDSTNDWDWDDKLSSEKPTNKSSCWSYHAASGRKCSFFGILLELIIGDYSFLVFAIINASLGWVDHTASYQSKWTWNSSTSCRCNSLCARCSCNWPSDSSWAKSDRSSAKTFNSILKYSFSHQFGNLFWVFSCSYFSQKFSSQLFQLLDNFVSTWTFVKHSNQFIESLLLLEQLLWSFFVTARLFELLTDLL